jgi:predicted RNase H-like HicB family nuclease
MMMHTLYIEYREAAGYYLVHGTVWPGRYATGFTVLEALQAYTSGLANGTLAFMLDEPAEIDEDTQPFIPFADEE